ncbi:MAG: hypothetical protein R3335_05880 [Anaerolineales bacterium]|nr:hypothetical protein [Anaerolineales bacterium]
MIKTSLEITETPKGRGTIHESPVDNPIAEAWYRLLVREDLGGDVQIEGVLQLIEGAWMLPTKKPFVLILEDMRRWPFYAKSEEPLTGTYRVTSSLSGDLSDWKPTF